MLYQKHRPVCNLLTAIEIQVFHITAQLGKRLHRAISYGLAPTQTQPAQKPSATPGNIFDDWTLRKV